MSYLPNKEVEIERLTGSLLSTPYFVRLFGSSKRWLKLKERSFLTKALSKRAIWVLFGLRVENITKLAAKPKPSNWPTARFGAMNSACCEFPWVKWDESSPSRLSSKRIEHDVPPPAGGCTPPESRVTHASRDWPRFTKKGFWQFLGAFWTMVRMVKIFGSTVVISNWQFWRSDPL